MAFEWPWQRRARLEREAFLTALDTIAKTAVANAQATERVAEAFLGWLKMFEATTAPRPRSTNDFTEAVTEAARIDALSYNYPSARDAYEMMAHVMDAQPTDLFAPFDSGMTHG
jgi:hypothetical protein